MELKDKIYKSIKDTIYEKRPNNNVIWTKKDIDIFEVPDKSITIEDVLKKFKPEELINAIGIEKVETILRAHKINKLKNKLK